MKSKETEIIKYLLKNKEEKNINQIAKEVRIDYKNAHSIIQRLQKKQVVTLEQFGNAWKVKLKNNIHPLLFEAEYERQQTLLKDKNIKTMLNYYKRNLSTKLYVLLLFGSYAKETQTKHSDIDLFFITSEEKVEKEIHKITALIPLKTHVNIFTEKQFKEMKNSKEKTVGSEAIKNNIILHGIEAYYELIQ